MSNSTGSCRRIISLLTQIAQLPFLLNPPRRFSTSCFHNVLSSQSLCLHWRLTKSGKERVQLKNIHRATSLLLFAALQPLHQPESYVFHPDLSTPWRSQQPSASSMCAQRRGCKPAVHTICVNKKRRCICFRSAFIVVYPRSRPFRILAVYLSLALPLTAVSGFYVCLGKKGVGENVSSLSVKMDDGGRRPAPVPLLPYKSM